MSEAEASAINSTAAKRWVGEILSSWKRSQEIRDRAKEEIRPDLEDEAEQRKGLYDAAGAAGLPRVALKLDVARQLDDWNCERKKKKREEKAGSDIVEVADEIKAALGDFAGTPLGGAAVARGGSDGDDEDLRGEQQRKREAEKLADMKTPEEGKKARGKKRSAALDDLAGKHPEGHA